MASYSDSIAFVDGAVAEGAILISIRRCVGGSANSIYRPKTSRVAFGKASPILRVQTCIDIWLDWGA